MEVAFYLYQGGKKTFFRAARLALMCGGWATELSLD
jgi:hypothetical protein